MLITSLMHTTGDIWLCGIRINTHSCCRRTERLIVYHKLPNGCLLLKWYLNELTDWWYLKTMSHCQQIRLFYSSTLHHSVKIEIYHSAQTLDILHYSSKKTNWMFMLNGSSILKFSSLMYSLACWLYSLTWDMLIIQPYLRYVFESMLPSKLLWRWCVRSVQVIWI